MINSVYYLEIIRPAKGSVGYLRNYSKFKVGLDCSTQKWTALPTTVHTMLLNASTQPWKMWIPKLVE